KRNTEDIEGRLSYAANKNTKQLMHNKFCVIDEKITVTGSFNPTERGDTKNDNNIIIIKSGYIAKNYLDEFSELYRSTFASGKKTKHPIIYLNGTKIENYFCPEDSCADHVIDTILQADKSIDFMTFSFTHDSIGDAIITQHKNNIKIRGIFETTQNNKWTEYKRLKSAGISVTWDKNPYNMHHKVFIIDNEIVITGSFNPSRSGDERNDENILIIHSKEIAEKYEKEFERLFR
ncbi:MAG: phospholipase D-like domain-containing protein, partial [archaeon]|nr:phospholipase D-like domain-containing protein [archaeon]